MTHAPQAVRTANAIGRWKRRANTAHRRPPPNVKELGRDKTIAALLERDGPLCQCDNPDCGKPVNPDKCEIEHKVPLWKVAHLPDEQRQAYFELANKRLMRPRCQLAKTKAEATERAHFERLTEKQQEHQARMAAKYQRSDDD